MIKSAIASMYESTPFEWGKHDCVTFSCAMSKVLTGYSPLDLVPWETRKQALETIKKELNADALTLREALGTGFVQVLLEKLQAAGYRECHPTVAPEGSLAIGQTAIGVCLCVRLGDEYVTAAKPRGVRLIPTQYILKVFTR